MRVRTLVAVLVPVAASVLFAAVSFAVQPGVASVGGMALIATLPVGIMLSVLVCRLLRTRLRAGLTLNQARLIGAGALTASWLASWLLSPILFALASDALLALLRLFGTISITGGQSTFDSPSFYGNVLILGIPAVAGLVGITAITTPLIVARDVRSSDADRWR